MSDAPVDRLVVARQCRLLVVDDTPADRRVLTDRLLALQQGYEVEQASSGVEALAAARRAVPDLILLDVMMPDLNGFEVCRLLRADSAFAAVPIVLVTSLDASADRVRGLEAGADDFVSKPYKTEELRARIRSLLRVKALYDQVAAQREELARWSATLSERVAEQLGQIERLARLKRFFSPALAERLVQDGDTNPMRSHRQDISVLFADLRGFTAFAEAVGPDVLMGVLGEFHASMGEAIHRHEGTLERFTGDGLMVFFNDPVPQADHVERALSLALEMQARGALLRERWLARGTELGLGLGLSCGTATLGAIGFDARQDYAAIGSVTNRAARLCAQARAGELLVCDGLWQRLPVTARPLDARGPEQLVLGGIAGAVPVYRVGSTSAPAAA
ncbi:adenylate/guanylate cyclase domain-containing response regulator [uncultured Methylibium sp.]|uniref:adenylate/guanylate cyclase domain-containing response regulator n=1 Tax=uncultured Methylibium sp. TaxID=381093 RepID=UPI0025CF4B04|nr:adenylate/guanylate cyclase domain-containing response regulator [uncultured Methylibium sp.]